MTVIKSKYFNQQEEEGKSIGGYKHRVHRSKKNRIKAAAWKRGQRIMKAAKLVKKLKRAEKYAV